MFYKHDELNLADLLWRNTMWISSSETCGCL